MITTRTKTRTKKLLWFTNCSNCKGNAEIKTDSIEKAMGNRKLHSETTGHDINQIWVYSDLIEEGF